MLRFALELLPSLALGLVLGRILPELPARLAPPLVRWGVPISLVGLLLRSGLHGDLLIAGLMAALASGGGLLLIRSLPLLRTGLPAGSLQLGSVVGNTAYWGLPTALALLPPEALAPVISYDLVGTLLTWSMGPLLVEGRAAHAGAVLAALGSSPASRGLLIALVLQWSPWREPIAALLWWPARVVVVLALSLVGMRLGLMTRPGAEPPRAGQGLGYALLTKLVLLPAALLGATALLPLPDVVRDAVVLQGAAPTAVSVLLIAEAAEAQGRSGEAAPAAALVLWSTLAALISVPLWWLLLQRQLTEMAAVITGEMAGIVETPVGRQLLHHHRIRLMAQQGCMHSVQTAQLEEGHGPHAQMLAEAPHQAAPTGIGDAAELLQGDRCGGVGAGPALHLLDQVNAGRLPPRSAMAFDAVDQSFQQQGHQITGQASPLFKRRQKLGLALGELEQTDQKNPQFLEAGRIEPQPVVLPERALQLRATEQLGTLQQGRLINAQQGHAVTLRREQVHLTPGIKPVDRMLRQVLSMGLQRQRPGLHRLEGEADGEAVAGLAAERQQRTAQPDAAQLQMLQGHEQTIGLEGPGLELQQLQIQADCLHPSGERINVVAEKTPWTEVGQGLPGLERRSVAGSACHGIGQQSVWA